MATAVARELARFARERSISEEDILPRMDEWEAFPRVAVAAALTAQQQGVARLAKTGAELHAEAERAMREAREATRLLMREGLIAAPPPRPNSARPARDGAEEEDHGARKARAVPGG